MKLLYTLSLVLFATLCYAQKEGDKQKRQNIYFFKNDGSPVTVQDSADFIRVITEADPGTFLYDIKEFYANGKIKLIGQTLRVVPVTLQGQSISYYPNGSKKLIGYYQHGQLKGKSYSFFPNGKLHITTQHFVKDSLDKTKAMKDSLFTFVADSTGKTIAEEGNGYYVDYNSDFKTIAETGPLNGGKRDGHWKGNDADRHITFEEDYADGQLIKGTAIDSGGVQTTYQQRNIPAEFKGGQSGLGQFIGGSVRYPPYAREHGIQGAVVIRFVITTEGKVSQIRIINSVSNDVDQEALRVIKMMPKWQPGLSYGKPIATTYTFPISFFLNN